MPLLSTFVFRRNWYVANHHSAEFITQTLIVPGPFRKQLFPSSYGLGHFFFLKSKGMLLSFVFKLTALIANQCVTTPNQMFFYYTDGVHCCPGFPFWKWTHWVTSPQEAIYLWNLDANCMSSPCLPPHNAGSGTVEKHRIPHVPTIRYCTGLIRELKWKKVPEEIITIRQNMAVTFIRNLWAWLSSMSLCKVQRKRSLEHSAFSVLNF